MNKEECELAMNTIESKMISRRYGIVALALWQGTRGAPGEAQALGGDARRGDVDLRGHDRPAGTLRPVALGRHHQDLDLRPSQARPRSAAWTRSLQGI
jgi:hypothetical protein